MLLSDLSAEIHRLPVEEARKLLDSQILAVQNHLIRLKRHRNELAPISRLPNEILCKIFALIRFSSSTHYDHIRIYEWVFITHVCREWREVCLGYRDMWSELRTDTIPYPWLELMWERSKGTPLSLQWHLMADTGGWADLLHRILGSPLTIVKDLELNGEPASLTTALRFLKTPSQSLRSLTIRNDSVRTRGWKSNPNANAPVLLPERFLSENGSALRILDLQKSFLPWNSGLFQGLTFLRLNFPPQSAFPAPTPTQLLDIFSRTPQLEHLDLNIPLPEMDDTLDKSRIARFPALASLKLSGMCSPVTALFARLRIPPSSQVHLTCVQSAMRDLVALGLALRAAWYASPLSPARGSYTNTAGGRFKGVIITTNGYKEGLAFACYTEHGEGDIPNPVDCEFTLNFPEEDDDSNRTWYSTTVLPAKACSRLLRTLPLDGISEATVGHWVRKEEMEEVLTILQGVKGLNLEEETEPAAMAINVLLDNASVATKTPKNKAPNILLPNLQWIRLHGLNVSNKAAPPITMADVPERSPVYLDRLTKLLQIRASFGMRLKRLEISGQCFGIHQADVQRLKEADVAEQVIWDEYEKDMISEFDSDDDDSDRNFGIGYELDRDLEPGYSGSDDYYDSDEF